MSIPVYPLILLRSLLFDSIAPVVSSPASSNSFALVPLRRREIVRSAAPTLFGSCQSVTFSYPNLLTTLLCGGQDFHPASLVSLLDYSQMFRPSLYPNT